MKQNKFLGITLIITLVSFAMSYVCASVAGLPSGLVLTKSVWKDYTNGTALELKEFSEEKSWSEPITEVEVHTRRTDIQIKKAKSLLIQARLHGQFPVEIVKDGNHIMSALIAGDKLTVDINEDVFQSSVIKFRLESSSGNVVLEIPSTVKKLTLKTVAGDINLDEADLAVLDLETVSGDVELNGTGLGLLKATTVSGEINMTGRVGEARVKSISGDIELGNLDMSPHVDANTTSGDVHLSFNNKPNVDVKFNSVSGGFELDSRWGHIKNEGRNANLTLGEGKGNVSIKTISGDLKIDSDLIQIKK